MDVRVAWHEDDKPDKEILQNTRSARRKKKLYMRRTHWAETTPRPAATAANWKKRETNMVFCARKDVLAAAKMVVKEKKGRAGRMSRACGLNIRLVEG